MYLQSDFDNVQMLQIPAIIRMRAWNGKMPARAFIFILKEKGVIALSS